MNVLNGLIPEKVFYYFEELSKIPRGSGDTTAVSNYCVDFAKEHGLEWYQDEFENVIIIKPASPGYENSDTVMIQGHLDMVNEKTPESAHDFSCDPLKLIIEGDWITADGTTLGGDDGIAVAYALAILDSDDIAHPRLECVFTTDEEVGMSGAKGLDCSGLKAKYLINLDSEDEGVFLAGCAGGLRYNINLPVDREKTEGLSVKFKLKNLSGGHSGCEIDKGRANAVLLMGRALYELDKKVKYRLISLSGGSKDNAIPRECSAGLVICEGDLPVFIDAVKSLMDIYKNEYALSDPEMDYEVKADKTGSADVFTENTKNKLLFLLNTVPNGVQEMSLDIPGLVETSLNLGIADTTESSVALRFSIRSSVPSRKQRICDKLGMITEYIGGEFSTEGDYPSWTYRRKSHLRDVMCRAYEELSGREAKVETIHAGLECGIISEKMPDIDIVSLGPDMKDIHTTEERLCISSTERVWRLVLETLKRLK